MDISVIIPALNEEAGLPLCLKHASGASEVILVDGGSRDDTVGVARRFGATVIAAPRGRGTQLDAGSAVARGGVLLFLHADTLLPAGWKASVERALEDESVTAGGFTLRIDGEGPFFRLVERAVRLRSLAGLIYGDQAIFVRKEAFFRAGGFRNLPLMEDVDCVKRLRRSGRVILLEDSVLTSGRRWARKGALRNTLKNIVTLSLYQMGVAPAALYKWYYKKLP